ncbi:MAG: polysaccharide biosynthesis protein [bacterium]|nr:polysaccharide biosynthesis protein [bacterium]
MKNLMFSNKSLLKGASDVLVWVSATLFAFILRLDGDITGYESQIVWLIFSLLPLKILLVWSTGSFRQSWRNIGFADLFQVIVMVGMLTIPFIGVIMIGQKAFGIPVSIPFIESILAILGLFALRALTRFFLKYRIPVIHRDSERKRVLIVGAGESGAMVAKEMLKNTEVNLEPVAFVDDDLSKRSQKIMGIPVRGTVFDLPILCRKYFVDEVVIALPSETGDVIRRVVEKCRMAEVDYRIIPGIYDLISGKVTISQLRNVDVEDLLRRKPVTLDTKEIKSYINHKRVLVTGAGGSIGSEIVRQISRFEPEQIILLGRGENSIHTLVREINDKIPSLRYLIRIADVRDRDSLERIFVTDRPEVVFHAAAHKHVPLMEENPSQAILNNVLGTRNLVNLAVEHGISHFVNISTDKAVNPTSVMGASKRISEYIVQWGAAATPDDRVFVSVRFGNVLGSRGSVIPIFKDQIQKGGPITVTHPDMIRYFMTIPEAAQLVIQAAGLGYNGAVYVLDMGEPVNIEQMARDLIRLSGLEPDVDIKIEHSGMRPGEKLYEELLTAEEGTDMTPHEKIFVARKSGFDHELGEKLDAIIDIAKKGDQNDIRKAIYELVPSFTGYKKAELIG